ncbi:MAG: hypothetical protein CL775_05195 [Chloroflexi bacterium]|nr:hypothetical protein [Chloroflexota bacterium]
MKIIGTFEVSKGYEHWKKTFMSHEPKRKEWGMETVFTGMEAKNQNIVHVCLEVESLEKVQEFMKDPENAKVIEEAGVKIETQIMIPIIE